MTVSRNDKIETLSSRVGLEQTILEKLPEESLNSYYNRSASGSIGSAMLSTGAACIAGIALLTSLATGNAFLAAMNMGFLCTNIYFATSTFNALSENAAISKDIQQEVIADIASPGRTGPINAPI